MAPPAGGAQASGLGGEPQEDQAPDARARFTSAAPARFRRHHRQRSRRARLPRSLQGARGRWPEPALGRRSDLHRYPRRLCLSGGDHGCVVAAHRGLRPGRRIDTRLTLAVLTTAIENRHPAASITPTEARNTPPKPKGPCSTNTAWPARWAGATTPATPP